MALLPRKRPVKRPMAPKPVAPKTTQSAPMRKGPIAVGTLEDRARSMAALGG